jgi:uncharacterized protein (TIGR00730 family)
MALSTSGGARSRWGKRRSEGLQAPEIIPSNFRTWPARVGAGRASVNGTVSLSRVAASTEIGFGWRSELEIEGGEALEDELEDEVRSRSLDDDAGSMGERSSAPARSRILVFCASSGSCAPTYHDAAAELGRALALASRVVVYGGGGTGSMGALANGALEVGGFVVGIQPRFMAELEWTHPGLSEIHLVENMQDRKLLMLEASDAVVALPGGTGTLDEVMEALTEKRLGHFFGPIVFVNQQGFFDPCLAQLERCIDERFMDPRHRELWSVVASPAEVVRAIDRAPEWSKDALDFAAV